MRRSLTRHDVERAFGDIYYTTTDDFGQSWKVRCPACKHRAMVVSEQLCEGHCFACEYSVPVMPNPDAPVVAEPRIVERVQERRGQQTAVLYPIDAPQSAAGLQYLLQRGITNYRAFNLSYCPFGALAGRVVIPIVQFGKMVGLQARTIFDDVEPKYLFSPRGFKKSACLYNMDAACMVTRTAIIVEGVTDVWRAHPYGISTFGARVAPRQQQLIAMHFDDCVLVPDADTAGTEGYYKAHAQLNALLPTRLCTLPLGVKDFGELTLEQAQAVVKYILSRR